VRLSVRGEYYATREEVLICGKTTSWIFRDFAWKKEQGLGTCRCSQELGNETWHPVVWGYTKYDHR
jgi:hypothetical protein